MKNNVVLINSLIVFSLFLSACSAQSPQSLPPKDQAAPTSSTQLITTPYQPAWISTPLVDVATGETFSFSDYKEKIVLLELIATWCPNCYWQQQQLQAVQKTLDTPDFVIISMSIDKNDDSSSLKKYAKEFGFTWKFTIATQDIIQDISKTYGPQMINAPAMPVLLIDRKGEVRPLSLGGKKPDDIKKALEPFLALSE
jgi:cytochrome oxidase Cu insertion factor (SCO1/SenC/PrrC family)